MLRKFCGILLIFAMMFGSSTSSFAASGEVQVNQKYADEYVQEYKGIKYDIRMNSAPVEVYQNLRTSNISDVPVDMKDVLHSNDSNRKHDIRLNSAPNDFFNNNEIKTDESVELNSNIERDFKTDSEVNAERSGMPTGGGEYPYAPSYWNDPANVFRANCYGYVLNRIANDTSNPRAGHMFQPGYRTGEYYKALTKKAIIKAVRSDMNSLGRTIRSSSYSEVPKSNEYKIALVIADNDYHWYRQDSDGGWSHKPGLTEITYRDASGKYISDPRTCDRNYNYANYSTWGGYYIISR